MIRWINLLPSLGMTFFLWSYPSGCLHAQSAAGLQSDVQVNGNVTTSATGGGAASTQIGTSDGRGSRSVTKIEGDVYTQSNGGSSSTEIGGQGKDGTTIIMRDVMNLGGKVRATGDTVIGGSVVTEEGAEVNLGGCGSVYVSGSVVVPNGSLAVGCGCAGYRNGQCCIEFHLGFCVLQEVPPSQHGCPPDFILSGGLCRLFSDFDHRVGY